MHYLLRFILVIILTWLVIAELYILAIPLFLAYVFFYTGFELVLLAVLIDGYYFAFYDWPRVTLFTFAVVLAMAFIKPRLFMYTNDDALLP